MGPAALVGGLPRTQRRLTTLGLFLFAAFVIFTSAERFADALAHTGIQWGIDEFLLVQWLAPLASEAPEFIVAFLWAAHGDAAAGLGALVSSAVNQWTLLVGMIPIAYSVGLGRAGALPLDLQQRHEILLTGCQSLLAVAILLNLRMSWYGAVTLLALFLAQRFAAEVRIYFALLYAVLGVLVLLRDRRNFWNVLRGRI